MRTSILVVIAYLLGTSSSVVHADDQKPDESHLNVLLICVDDLRPELGCYGVDYIKSPHIDQLASSGRTFARHYVQAPTCGASRYALLTGRYGGASNGALFERATRMQRGMPVPVSLPAWFRKHGYSTASFGKVSHHPGGLGGPDWNDPDILEMPDAWDTHVLDAGVWQHPRGWMHGLAHGEIRKNAKDMDVFQSISGPATIYPDGITVEAALEEMQSLASNTQPFFLAVGILRPHLPFGAPAEYMTHYQDLKLPDIPHPQRPADRTTWHASGEFMKYNRWGRDPNRDSEFAELVRKHYAACVSFADAQVGRILEQLEAIGESDQTIVVLWGDHGWHLGEHSIWGKHSLFEESLRSPLIIRTPGMELAGSATRGVVETIDIFPTLCQLVGIELPDDLAGSSLEPLLVDPSLDGRAAISYHRKATTIRDDQFRLVMHEDGFCELYDHDADGETSNVAARNPEVVRRLKEELERRLD